MSDLTDKWDRQYAAESAVAVPACEVLQQNMHLLPSTGKALDYASGLGGNARLLARKKLETYAWDISQVALEKLGRFASSNKLNLKTEVRDVEKHPPEPLSFDVVVVSRFLHRPGFSSLLASIRERGLLFYQTFTEIRISRSGPSNPDYLLKPNELLHLCDDMEVLVYREEGMQGSIQSGWRDQAMIVARKPVQS